MRNLVFGKNVIENLLIHHSKIIKCLYFATSQLELFKDKVVNFPVEIWTEEQFDKYFPKEKHQKIAAEIKEFPSYSFIELLKNIEQEPSKRLILVLDRIQDPQNFGAIVRTAVACGVDTIIIAKTKQAPINATLAKVSSGTVFAAKLVIVANLHNALLKLKKAHFWIVSAEMKGQTAYDETNFSRENVVLILGNEANGVSPLLQKISDFVVYIPMIYTESLNVNASAAILLYEIRKQQHFWKKT